MGILRKLGAGTTAVAMLGVGVLTAASTADAAAPAAKTVVAPKVAPKAVVAPMVATKSATATTLVPGKLRLDKRCMTGRILCSNKKTRKLVFMVNGKLQAVVDARYGAPRTPTRNGMFKVYRKDKNHVSTLYHSPMPDSMFFSGGQAVHYSSDFKARGYNGASHGCLNVRDRKKLDWIFARVPVGTKVLIYSA